MKVTSKNVGYFIYCLFILSIILSGCYGIYKEVGLLWAIMTFIIISLLVLMFLFIADIIEFSYEIKLPWEKDKMTEEERELFEEWKKERDER